MKQKLFTIGLLAFLFLMVSCTAKEQPNILNVDSEQVHKLLQSEKNLLVLDVRSQKEYNSGHLEGAVLIPYDELESRLKEISSYDKVLVYCRSGKRSSEAVKTLSKLDLDTIYHYKDGFITWNYETVRVSGQ